MPTSIKAYAAVANALADIDPGNSEAVTLFYRRQFFQYPAPVQALIADFLVGQTDMPSLASLSALKQAVNLPVEQVPGIEVPVWDEAFGAAMEYRVITNHPESTQDRTATGSF